MLSLLLLLAALCFADEAPTALALPEGDTLRASFPLKPGTNVESVRLRWWKVGDTLEPIPAGTSLEPNESGSALVLTLPESVAAGTYSLGIEWVTSGEDVEEADAEAEEGDGEHAEAGPRRKNQNLKTLSVAVEGPTVAVVLPASPTVVLGLGESNPLALEIAESSGRRGVSPLSLDWVAGVSASGALSRGSLICDAEKAEHRAGAQKISLPAGGRVRVICETRDFKTGTSAGVLRASGPGLARPVTTPASIQTRRSMLWIPLVIGLGAALGKAIQGPLKDRADLALAVARAREAVTGLRRMAAESADNSYRDALGAAARALSEAMVSARRADVLDKAIEAAKTASDQAAAALELLQTKVSGELATLAQALAPRWALPSRPGAALRQARVCVDRAHLALGAHNPTAAAAALEAANVQMKALAEATREWATKAAFALGPRAPAEAPVPPTLAPLYAHLSPSLADLINVSKSGAELLDPLHSVWALLGRDLEPVTGAIARDLLAALTHLSKMGKAKDMEGFERHLAGLRTWAELTEAEALLAAVSGVLRPAAEALEGLMAPLREKASEADQAKVSADLGAGRYAQGLRTLLPPPVMLGGTPTRGDEAIAVPLRTSTLRDLDPGESRATPALGAAGRLSTGAASRIDWPLTYDLIVGGIAVLLASVQFIDGWVGGQEDLVRAFAWGFGADLGLTGLLAVVTALRSGASH